MSVNRRRFIKTGLTTGLGITMVRNVRLFGKDERKARLGFIGVGGRGTGHLRRVLRRDDVDIPAICDINMDNLTRAINLVEEARGKKPEGYSRNEEDFRRMVERDDLDGTIISTPWEWHAPMSIASMKAGKYAGVEVPGAITVDECWELVNTSESTGMPCMLLENVCYRRDCMAVLNMVRQGLFGELLHCECGYQHYFRNRITRTDPEIKWRERHNMKRNSDLYPTHGVGPMANCLNIDRGNRFVYLTSTATKVRAINYVAERVLGRSHPVAKRKYVIGDIVTSVVKCSNGETVTINHNIHSPRPYSLNFRVEGTMGIWQVDNKSIYLESIEEFGSSERRHPKWEPFEKYQKEYDHPLWKKYEDKAVGSGHGGMDFFITHAFIESIKRRVPTPINVYDTVSWSVITPLSEQSIANGSAPIQFPDFTRGEWVMNKPIFGLNDEF